MSFFSTTRLGPKPRMRPSFTMHGAVRLIARAHRLVLHPERRGDELAMLGRRGFGACVTTTAPPAAKAASTARRVQAQKPSMAANL